MNGRRFSGLLALVAVCAALPLCAQAPLNLYNGTLLGWNQRGGWTASGGTLNSSVGQSALVSAVPFGDYDLRFEYNETAPSGARLRVVAEKGGSGGSVVHLSSPGAGGIDGGSRPGLGTLAPGWHRVQIDHANGRLSVQIDGAQAGMAQTASGAGYLAFETSGSGALQLRNLKLTPQNPTTTFNGTDLSGWKVIARGPESNGGIGHDVKKTFTFGLGGGSTKAHMPKWTVRNGAIHGEDGPGGLESTTPIQDGIIQLTANVKESAKDEDFSAVSLRTDPGKLDGGYQVGIGEFSGSIKQLAKRPANKSAGSVDETIVVGGRTIAVWNNGNLVNVHTDPRPESGNPAQGAKTAPGALTLLLADGAQMDVQRLAFTSLQRGSAPAPVLATAVPATPTVTQPNAEAAAATASANATTAALVKQQNDAARQAAEDKANKQRSAALMSQALSTNDAQQQMSLYQQVVQIDPSNAAAVQGFKDAQARVQAAAAAEQTSELTQVKNQETEASRQQQTQNSLLQAQTAFLGGHVKEAGAALAVAERLSPDNPLVRDLRSRINASNAFRSRMLMLGSGAGLLGLLGILAAWLRRRKMQQFPLLEVSKGVETGKQFPVDKDVVRIGAVAQDGGQKNDIVIQDVEHAISRFHCQLSKQNGQLYLTDLQSSNGTRVNGERLEPGQPVLLRKGARIDLANTVELRLGYGSRRKA